MDYKIRKRRARKKNFIIILFLTMSVIGILIPLQEETKSDFLYQLLVFSALFLFFLIFIVAPLMLIDEYSDNNSKNIENETEFDVESDFDDYLEKTEDSDFDGDWSGD